MKKGKLKCPHCAEQVSFAGAFQAKANEEYFCPSCRKFSKVFLSKDIKNLARILAVLVGIVAMMYIGYLNTLSTACFYTKYSRHDREAAKARAKAAEEAKAAQAAQFTEAEPAFDASPISLQKPGAAAAPVINLSK